MPLILISICSAVTPSAVPATLKSISPRASSMPWISLRMAHLPLRSPSPVIRPMATPATGAEMGTPASMRDRVVPQTDPIGDGADGFQVAAIGAYAMIKDVVAYVGLQFLLIESHNFFQAIWILYAQALHQFFLYHAQRG